MNQTVLKFGYPRLLVGETPGWVVLLRARQVTAGSLVLAAKSDATSLADLPGEIAGDLAPAAARVERCLREAVGFEKINYLALMMVDPHVHFHVIPRYEGERPIGRAVAPDTDWPGPPDVMRAADVAQEDLEDLLGRLREAWPRP